MCARASSRVSALRTALTVVPDFTGAASIT
jgi:hypothetical protein